MRPDAQEISARPDWRGGPLAAVLSCLLLVGLSIAFVDRPVATWSHNSLHGIQAFVALTHLVDPILPASALGLIAAGFAALNGWRPRRLGRTLIACFIGALLAYAIKDQAKFAFGRLWPETWVNDNPSWIGTGAYGFFPFHGGAGWGSFPSGHTSGIAAPAGVMWKQYPRWRWIYAVLVAAVAIGLVGADYHFFADILAGLYLGVACGIGILAALQAGWSHQDLNAL